MFLGQLWQKSPTKAVLNALHRGHRLRQALSAIVPLLESLTSDIQATDDGPMPSHDLRLMQTMVFRASDSQPGFESSMDISVHIRIEWSLYLTQGSLHDHRRLTQYAPKHVK